MPFPQAKDLGAAENSNIQSPASAAHAASGHAAAPPISVMNSRRFIWSNCIRSPTSQGRIGGYRIGEDQSGGKPAGRGILHR